MHQPHRILRRYPVQIGSEHIASLGQLALIPAIALQPFARFEPGDARLYPPNHLGDARGIAEVNVVELLDAGFGDVRMAVDESRRRGAAVQVDAPRGGAGEAQEVPIRADGDDPSIAYRHAL